MRRVETLVVGAGQAGLAVSRCLTEHAAEHVVVEQDRVAERWRSARWDSLRLLTPNWMSRLPAWSYAGTDPDGYMAGPELVRYLEHYAGSFAAPVHENTTVERVEAHADGLRVVTSQRTWLARNVVVATGTENRAYVPPVAGGIDPRIRQLTAGRYRGPHQIPDGGVLVVGASASGVQIADELRRSGRPVTISVGRHSRVPRRYRGRDILWWMDRAGILDQIIDQMRDARSARRAPSLQLSGRSDYPVCLEALAAGGVTLAGWLVAADGRQLSFADDLPATIGGAQARMERLLRTIDGYIAHNGRDECTGPAEPPPPPAAAVGPVRLDLGRAGIAHRDLGDRLPAGLSLAAGSRAGPVRRDRPPPRRDRCSWPLRAGSEVPVPPQFHLRRRRRTRRAVRGRPRHAANDRPRGRPPGLARPERLTRSPTENPHAEQEQPVLRRGHRRGPLCGRRDGACCWPGREPGCCCWTGPGTAQTPYRRTR